MGLGDAVEEALAAVGISAGLVKKWIGRPCGCAERRAKLNQLGWWAARVLTGKRERAAAILRNILEEE